MALEMLRSAIDDFAGCPLLAPEAELRDAALLALKALRLECLRVQGNANAYRSNPIRPDVGMDDAALGPIAEELAAFLNQRGLYDLEEEAQALRCNAVLAVHGQYHHIVGPAILARAECNERLGNTRFAGRIYQTVVADFNRIVDRWEARGEEPTDEDRCSLQCLSRAIEGVLKFRPDGTDERAMGDLYRRVSDVLARSRGSRGQT